MTKHQKEWISFQLIHDLLKIKIASVELAILLMFVTFINLYISQLHT